MLVLAPKAGSERFADPDCEHQQFVAFLPSCGTVEAMWGSELQIMEEEGDEDGYATPTSQTIRVYHPPPPPRKKRYKKSRRMGKNLEIGDSELQCKTLLDSDLSVSARNCCRLKGSENVSRRDWSGKCSSCGYIGKLRPGRTICFRLDCALNPSNSNRDRGLE